MWAVQISASHTLVLHGPLLFTGSNFGCSNKGVFEPQTTHTVSIPGFYITPKETVTSHSPATKAHGRIYRDKLQKEIKNIHSPFASGKWVSLCVPVIAGKGANMPIISKLSANIAPLGYCKTNSLNYWHCCPSGNCFAVITAIVFPRCSNSVQKITIPPLSLLTISTESFTNVYFVMEKQ